MSDWSVVILSWSTVDDGPKELTNRHYHRFVDIALRWAISQGRMPSMAGAGWMFDPGEDGHDESELGAACEAVAVTHENNFDHLELLEVLASFEWEKPEYVHLLYKSEQMDNYAAHDLSQYLNHPEVLESEPRAEEAPN